VTRWALARFKASRIRHSSIRLKLTGEQVDWTTKMSQPPDVGSDLHADLAIAEGAELGRQQGATEMVADGCRQSGIGRTGEDFQIALRHAEPLGDTVAD